MPGYCIRPGFLAPGLPAKSEEQEQEIGAPVLLGRLGPNDDAPGLSRPIRDIPKTFRTISRVDDIEKENAQWIPPPRRVLPRRESAFYSTPRYWSEGPSSAFTKARNSALAQDSWMNSYNIEIPEWTPPRIPRPAGVDDDKSVPGPEVDGLSHMWSMASALARNLDEHLMSLKEEYIKTTPTVRGTNANLVERLIERFDDDKKAQQSLRLAMCRHRSAEALQVFAGYQEAVHTLRTRLNAWLEAWDTHEEDLKEHDSDDSMANSPLLSAVDHGNGHCNGHPDDDRDSSQDVDIVHDEHGPFDIVKQHLRDWLVEIDGLPDYPSLETYIEKNRPQFWTWAYTEQKEKEKMGMEKKQPPKVEEKKQAMPVADLFDQSGIVTPQQSTGHARQGYAPQTMEEKQEEGKSAEAAKSAGKEHKRDTSTSLFDHFRTDARRSFDERARQGHAPKTPRF
ncbi:hypothetical protein GE09DRAFT_1213722 [Coniochaeta sp. 2T2.1]|nr:hypothetical protein GE09DRAFT_1213722 [Coniochaeta sp. 2T2.1]